MFSNQINNAKLAIKVRLYGSRSLNKIASKVYKMADSEAISQLWQRVASTYANDHISAAKYAQTRYWLLFNTLRLAELGLHNTSPLRILDIGCGPGFFVALTRVLGHDCHGVDAPDSYLTDTERDVYSTLTRAFHCNEVVSPLLIERFKPMPFRDQPFDLITAFWICFNRHRQTDEWGMDEWKFFIEDAFHCLLPGGRMVLDINEHRERYGDLRFYDTATRDYFNGIGNVNQGRVIIKRP